MIITSKANRLIKQAKKLLQKKHRKHSYLIEGWHLFEEAQRSGQELIHIFVLEEMAGRLSGFDQVIIVSPEVLKELTSSPKDRKSTRLNSSHANISYAVFCLKKKNKYAL